MKQYDRRRVAEAPQDDAADRGAGRDHRIDRARDVERGRFEGLHRTRRISHAAHVEAQGGHAGAGERTGEVDELTMAAGAVLRSADHDHDAGVCAGRRFLTDEGGSC